MNELQRQWALVQRLYSRTLEGKVNWEPGGDEWISTQLGEYRMTLLEILDPIEPDWPDFRLNLYREGQLVDAITNGGLRSLSEEKSPEGMNPYQTMRQTYALGRRKALGVDKALDDIIRELS